MTRALLIVALVGAVFSIPPAAAQLFPALPDGGSIVTSAGSPATGNPAGDGGGPFVTVDTAHVTNWTASLRCNARLVSPRVHYRFSADGGTARLDDPLLDLDTTKQLEIEHLVNATRTERIRYLSLRGEDGGPPYCYAWQDTIP